MSEQHRLSRWTVYPAIVIALLGMLAFPPVGRVTAQGTHTTTTHVVAWGETLYTIAHQYRVAPQAIIDANGLANPDHLYAGQQLIIPGADGSSQQAATTPAGKHIVQPGENLYRIGLKYGLTVNALMSANGLVNADQIYAGQLLIIPGGEPAAPSSGSQPPASTQAHKVKPGETLFAIATRYGVTVWALTQANDIGNPSTLYAGQVLTIPSGSTQPSRSDDVPPSAGVTKTYSVQRGDTLFRIAARANVPISALMAANAITAPDHIYVGQVLTLPLGAGDIPATNAAAPSTGAPTITDGKQIVIDLSEQRVYAFENGQAVRQFVVSTGLSATPTVTGDYAIYAKHDSQAMSGPGYSLPNVPWVMYFYRGYGLHGTYWHNNFGQPMSHGCVNMRTAEAEWLYNWAPLGTPVRVVW